MRHDLTPQRLLSAYMAGIFPMADEVGGVHWLAPDPRAIIELDGLQISRSLRTVLRRGKFQLKIDVAFEEVITACSDREDGTWISHEIVMAYCALRDLGYAHSVEAWINGRLAGGLYGVALGGAFFGESMFHRETDASKAALVFLVHRMQERGMRLLDVQFMTPHLRSLGATEIPRNEYERRLSLAVKLPVCFGNHPPTLGEQAMLAMYENA